MKNKWVLKVSTLLLTSLIVTACGTTSTGTTDELQTTTKISVVGSTTVTVPMELLANTYQEKNPNIVIEVQGVGSSAGVKAAHEKTADIGMASREIKESEKTYGLKEIPIAHDGIAVVIHPSNNARDLTMEQVKGIYEGTITNWKEVGGADRPIIVVTREAGAGTRGAFEEIVGLHEDRNGKDVSTITPIALVGEGNGTIKATVASKKDSIGFISLGTVDETVKALSIEGVPATAETVLEGEYPISRRLLILTQPEQSEKVSDFITFILGEEGQDIVSEHYIPVS